MLTFRREAAIIGGAVCVGGWVRVGSGPNRGRAVASAVGASVVGAGAAVTTAVGPGAIVATGVGAAVASGAAGVAAGAGAGVGTTDVGVGVAATSTGSSPPVHIALIKTIIATIPTRMCNMSLSDLPFRQCSARPTRPHHSLVADLKSRANLTPVTTML